MSNRPSMLRRGITVTSLLALTGLLPALTRAWQASAFDADRVSDVLAALGGSAPVESPLLRLSCPDVAENGASVPLGISTSLAGISTLMLLVEDNPNPLVALFKPLQGVEADFSLQAKLTRSSAVYAVALMADGRAYFSRRRVEVAQGACGA